MLRKRSPQGADDAGGDGRFEAERAADGHDQLADPQTRPSRRAWHAASRAASAWTTARSVQGSVPTSRPAKSRPSLRRTRSRSLVADHVSVGQQKAVGREQDARSRSLARGRGRLAD